MVTPCDTFRNTVMLHAITLFKPHPVFPKCYEQSKNKQILLSTWTLMSLFSWLLIGHLIGDWLLQNDNMARHKQSAVFSQQCLFHCTVYSITELVVLWMTSPVALNGSLYILFLLTIFISHWIIDAFSLASRWGRWLKQTDAPFVRIVVDQTFHLITIAVVIETLLI